MLYMISVFWNLLRLALWTIRWLDLWMFNVSLKRKHVLQLLGAVFLVCPLGHVCWSCHSNVLPPYWSLKLACSISYWEMCKIFLFNYSFCLFLLVSSSISFCFTCFFLRYNMYKVHKTYIYILMNFMYKPKQSKSRYIIS